MPTYDYQCQECDYKAEVFHAMSAEPLRDCPECGKPALKRLIGTGAGLLFKGSGFYQTDYRSEGYKKAAKEDSGSSKKEAAPKETKSKDTGSGTASAPASA